MCWKYCNSRCCEIFNKVRSLNLQCIVISEDKTTINPEHIRTEVSSIVAYSKTYENLSDLYGLQMTFKKSIISQRSTDENGTIFLNFHIRIQKIFL